MYYRSILNYLQIYLLLLRSILKSVLNFVQTYSFSLRYRQYALVGQTVLLSRLSLDQRWWIDWKVLRRVPRSDWNHLEAIGHSRCRWRRWHCKSVSGRWSRRWQSVAFVRRRGGDAYRGRAVTVRGGVCTRVSFVWDQIIGVSVRKKTIDSQPPSCLPGAFWRHILSSS